MTRSRIEYLATERGAIVATADEIRELATTHLRLVARVEREMTAHADAIRAGMEAARRKGRHIGRPRVEIDSARIAALWADGYGLKGIARETGYARATVRRRLDELGFGREPRP